MKKILLLFLAFISVGCSSDPSSFWRSPTAIVDSIKSLEGKPIESAIDKLGLPQAEQNIAGKKILLWYNSDKAVSSYGQAFYLPDGSLNITALSREFHCVVRGVISEGKITHIEVKANSVYYCPGQ